MKYRKLTAQNDYSFGNGLNDFYYDKEAIAQAIKTKILLFYGEWWEDITIGIPMFQSILGQVDQESIKTTSALLLRKRILETPGVRSVDDIQTEIIKRTLRFTIYCTTVENEQVEVEVSI